MTKKKNRIRKDPRKQRTHVGFGPENEDLSHHPEKFLCIWVWTGQPPRPADKESNDSNGLTQALKSKSVGASQQDKVIPYFITTDQTRFVLHTIFYFQLINNNKVNCNIYFLLTNGRIIFKLALGDHKHPQLQYKQILYVNYFLLLS